MPRLTSFAVALTAIFTLYMSNAARAEAISGAPFEIKQPADESMFDHELNDAWLGMPVIGPNGTEIGYVLDAPLDNHGWIVEVVVGEMVLSNDEAAWEKAEANAITFAADRVDLLDDHVALLPLDPQLVADASQVTN